MRQAAPVSSPSADDHAGWRVLFDGYCAFYGVEVTDAHVTRVWGWLHDPQSPAACLLAKDAEGVPVGLAHYRTWQWPLRGSVGCYLDDLYVDPAHRGSGIATTLLGSLRELAATRGWETVRWITREDNPQARRLYDRLAEATSLITYDLNPINGREPAAGDYVTGRRRTDGTMLPTTHAP